MKRQTNVDLFSSRPDIQFYLMIKPFLWPYYFVTEKSPLERFSELFFKHYGEKGHTYFGSEGFKNFLHDIVYGRNRYLQCDAQKINWQVDEKGDEYLAYRQSFGKDKKEILYAEIIYAQFKGIYLLKVVWSTKQSFSCTNFISRFELDGCDRLKESQFKKRLLQINLEKAKTLFSQLNLS